MDTLIYTDIITALAQGGSTGLLIYFLWRSNNERRDDYKEQMEIVDRLATAVTQLKDIIDNKIK